MAIGVITSEIVSNVIKYAFTEIKDPTVHVTLTQNSEVVLYSVKDNGVDFDTQKTSTGLGVA